MTEMLPEVGEELNWLGRPVRALLFDMDGTLAHTREAHADVWVTWAAENGLGVTREQYLANLYGRSNYDAISELMPHLAGKRDEIAAMADVKEAIFRRMVVEGRVPLMAGAAAFIHRAAEWGLPMAVASAAPRENVDVVLEKLGVGEHFEVRVGDRDVARTKPAPDAYLLAAERLRVDPRECVVFEDTRFGLQAGRAAGCRTVAILSQHSEAEVADLADLSVRDFDALAGLEPWASLARGPVGEKSFR
jgi:HAD superfamily hydrolase (TIGR01509 family)